MSDRAIPRSFRMMEGFGVHTFRFVNERGQVALRQVPLEAAARRPLARLGRGAEDRRQGPRLPPPRSLGGHRERRLSRSTSSACRSSSEDGRAQLRLRPARRHQDRARGAGPGAARRQADAQPQPGQLLRRDRAGRLPPRPRRAGHRLHERPAAAGPPLLLPRHAAQPPRQRQLRRDPDQPPASRRCTTTSATAHAPDGQPGPGGYQPELARRRLPMRPAPTAAASSLPGARRGPQGARAQRELPRPLQPGHAVLEQPSRAEKERHRRGLPLRARQGGEPGRSSSA